MEKSSRRAAGNKQKKKKLCKNVHIRLGMRLQGYKNIYNTLLYTQLITFESDEYHSAVAKTVQEAKALVEEGFEYVCTHNDIMLFRKRK